MVVGYPEAEGMRIVVDYLQQGDTKCEAGGAQGCCMQAQGQGSGQADLRKGLLVREGEVEVVDGDGGGADAVVRKQRLQQLYQRRLAAPLRASRRVSRVHAGCERAQNAS